MSTHFEPGPLHFRSNMKILWLCPELPYPLTTGFLRIYSLMREMSLRHDITLVCLTERKEVTQETIDALTAHATSLTIVNELSYPEPWFIKLVKEVPYFGARIQLRWRKRNASAEMRGAVQRLLRKQPFDIVLLGGRYTLPAVRGIKLPMVMDYCDANCARYLGEVRYAPLLRRPLMYLRYLRMKRLELHAARMTPYSCFASERDRNALLGPSSASEVVPQGLDSEYWRRSGGKPEPNCVVFTGAMDYSPNDDGARFLIREVLPLVRQAIPEFHTLIVGRDPLPALIAAAQSSPDVIVTGAVPDIRPYLEKASVYVAPLRFASGVQNKVLEAMAMEVPVITTPVVADGVVMDGVPAPLVVAQSAQEIADQIIALLRDGPERERLGHAGREFVTRHCSWPRSAEKLEEMCMAAISSTKAVSGASSPRVSQKQCA